MFLISSGRQSVESGRGVSRTSVVVVALCALLAGLPAPAAAQNLLVNPNLDASLTGWNTGPNTTFDSTQGSPSPGSARFAATLVAPVDPDDAVTMEQCVSGIIPGATYSFGGRVLLNLTAPEGAVGGIAVIWSNIPNCDDDTAVEVAPPITTGGSFQSTSWSAVAPAGMVSAQLVVLTTIAAIGPGPIDPADAVFLPGTYDTRADTLFFQLEAEPVPTMNGLWLAVLAIALALVATLGLRSFRRANA